MPSRLTTLLLFVFVSSIIALPLRWVSHSIGIIFVETRILLNEYRTDSQYPGEHHDIPRAVAVTGLEGTDDNRLTYDGMTPKRLLERWAESSWLTYFWIIIYKDRRGLDYSGWKELHFGTGGFQMGNMANQDPPSSLASIISLVPNGHVGWPNCTL